MKKQPPIHIAQAHDHFFKQAMSDQRVAQDFFAAHLPSDLLQAIDLRQLTLQPGSYIDDLRQTAIVDLLFKTTIQASPAYLYLLIEHQSKPRKLHAISNSQIHLQYY